MSETRDALFEEFALAHVTRLEELLRKQEMSLIQAARDRRGRLTLEEIQAACRQVSGDKRELTLSLAGLVREFELWLGRRSDGDSRQNLLGRLTVQPFEHLCEGHFDGGIRQGALSRRMIPAFLRATAFLVGSQHCDAWQNELALLHDKLNLRSKQAQKEGGWNVFYHDELARTVSLRMSARFLSRFHPYEKRRDWFLAYMNDHLGEIQKNLPRAGSDDIWHFQEKHYLVVMDSFTKGLREVLQLPKQQQSLRLSLSKERLSKLKAAVAHLDEELSERR
jgi:hypothetical protein